MKDCLTQLVMFMLLVVILYEISKMVIKIIPKSTQFISDILNPKRESFVPGQTHTHHLTHTHDHGSQDQSQSNSGGGGQGQSGQFGQFNKGLFTATPSSGMQQGPTYTPQGNSLPLTAEALNQIQLYGPPIDSNINSRKSLFMFKHNKCSTKCCPSTYSCSGGCICMSDSQKNFINRRGIVK